MEEKRGFTIRGRKHRLTLTELRTMLDGTPTKHVLALWDKGERGHGKNTARHTSRPV